jgi:Cys-rich repeat protein
MDTERFDRLSRLIGHGTSRRQALIGLLSGILGAALGRSAALGQGQTPCQQRANDYRKRAGAICLDLFRDTPENVFVCTADFDICADLYATCADAEALTCAKTAVTYWQEQVACQNNATQFRKGVVAACVTAFKHDPRTIFTCSADFDICADLMAKCEYVSANTCRDTAAGYWKKRAPAKRSGTCAPPTVRAFTHCDVDCLTDADCPSGEVCDFISGHCLPACGSDADCPTGQACEAGWCVPIVCTSNDDCPSDQVCQSGLCVPDDAAPACTSNAECPVGQVCSNGLCVPCGSDAECSSGHVCDAGACVTGTRLPGGSTTLCPSFSDFECPAGQVCRGGACMPGDVPTSGCVSDAECPYGDVCAGGVCIFAGECFGDSDCPSDRPRCNDQFTCYNPADLP